MGVVLFKQVRITTGGDMSAELRCGSNDETCEPRPYLHDDWGQWSRRNQGAQAQAGTGTGDSDLSAVKDESLIEEILAFLRGGADGAILTILGLFIGNWTLAAAASIANPSAMATSIRAAKKLSNAFLPLARK